MARQRSKAELINYRYKRKQLIEKLGGCCVRCGFDDWRALQVDHKTGNGSLTRAKGRLHYLIPLLKTGDIQLLCANCNQIKRYENGEGVVIRATKEHSVITNPLRAYKEELNPSLSQLQE